MKNLLCGTPHDLRVLLRRIFFVMKLTTALLICICLHASAKTYSQRVTLSESNVPLQKVFKQIRKQTGYQFLYRDDLIQEAAKITINVKDVPIEEALDECFKDQPLSYTVIERTILVKKKVNAPVQPVISEEPPPAEIKGRLLDENGKPLQGVSVTNPRLKKGTSTNAEGEFSIQADVDDVLEFSFVGYKAQSVRVGSLQQFIKLEMKLEVAEYANSVVIGYGTVKKSDLTGSVSTISAEKITQVKAVSSVAQTLQGQAAGVQVNQASGQPGEQVIIKIRGTNSIGADNTPLYVVDGMPLPSLSVQLNPDDIANIQVLKDASSVAIYGSRGANGVILITTKKGRNSNGKAQVAYNGYFGVQTLRKKIKLVNAAEYAELQNEVITNDNTSGLNNPQLPMPWTSAQIDSLKGKGTDWQDLVYRPANVQDHDISITGGNENTRYYTSFGFYDQDGIIHNSNYTRLSFRGNLDQKINERLNLATSLSLQHSRYFQLNNGNADYGGIPFQTMVMPPTQGVYDANGNYTVFTGVTWGQTNPVGMSQTLWNPDNSLRLIGNTAVTYEIIDGLKLRASVGVDNTWDRQDYYVPPTNTFGQPAGAASASYSNSLTFVNENTLSYLKKFGQHTIDAVGGITYQSTVYKNLTSGTATGFISTIYLNNNIQSASTKAQPGTGYSNNKLVSYQLQLRRKIFCHRHRQIRRFIRVWGGQ